VFISNNLVTAGLVVLAFATTGVMLMIGDFLFGRAAGFAIAAAAAIHVRGFLVCHSTERAAPQPAPIDCFIRDSPRLAAENPMTMRT
jgi:hypothetical protein